MLEIVDRNKWTLRYLIGYDFNNSNVGRVIVNDWVSSEGKYFFKESLGILVRI